MSLPLRCPACEEQLLSWSSPDCACDSHAQAPLPKPFHLHSSAGHGAPRVREGQIASASDIDEVTSLELLGEWSSVGEFNDVESWVVMTLSTILPVLHSLSSPLGALESTVTRVQDAVDVLLAFSAVPTQLNVMMSQLHRMHSELGRLVKKHCCPFAWQRRDLHRLEMENNNRRKVVEAFGFLPHDHPDGPRVEPLTAIFVDQTLSAAHSPLAASKLLTAISTLLVHLGMPFHGLLVVTPVARKNNPSARGYTLWASSVVCNLLLRLRDGLIFMSDDGCYFVNNQDGDNCMEQLNRVASMIELIDAKFPGSSPTGAARGCLRFRNSDVVLRNIMESAQQVRLLPLLPRAPLFTVHT